MSTDEATGARLLDVYRRYLGEPAREIDVYAGFALFFGGIALGTIGLAVFVMSAEVPAGEPLFWQLREIAIGLAFIGLPAFVLSVVVLLPVGRTTLVASGLGVAVCLVAVAVFVAVYPENWNVRGATDYSVQGIAIYAAGLTVLVGATGSALVAHHLQRAGEVRTVETQAAGTDDVESTETVTDEQVRRDIEEATRGVDLTWGGVERTESKRLRFRDAEIEAADRAAFETVEAKTARSTGVDPQLSALRKLKGGDVERGSAEGVDDQTAALQDLRARQAAEDAERPDSVLDRVRARIGFR